MLLVSPSKPMTPNYPPPELKGFHNRNMLHAFLTFLVPIIAGSWAYYRQEAYLASDALQNCLAVVFIIGAVWFVLTILYNALVATPKCPHCHRRMKQTETINLTKKAALNLQATTPWQIVECHHCDLHYRVPSLKVRT